MDLEIRPTWRDQLGLLLLSAVLGLATVASLIIHPGGGLSPVVLALTLTILTLIAILVLLYRHYAWRFQVHDGAVESCYGIIARDIRSIRIRDLRNINIRQSIVQRVLAIGDVEFSSAGGADIEVTFFGVHKPLELKRRIQALEEASAD